MACEKTKNAIVCTRGNRQRRKQSGFLSKAQSAAAKALLEIVPEIGREYIVTKYWTGTFKGRLLSISAPGTRNELLRFVVIDAMRPGPLIEVKCPFPECTAEEGHGRDHEFSEILRDGAELDIAYGAIHLRPVAIETQQKATA